MPSAASGLKTRQALINAAIHFLGQGKNEVTIQEIAAKATVSVGSVYTHFSDKQELFEVAAVEALLASLPPLQAIAEGIEDPALAFIGIGLFACSRHEFDPITTRIIITVGPIGFANDNQYLEQPKQMIKASVDKGLATCDDIEAFVLAASGAYQNVLAFSVAGNASKDLGKRVMWLFAEMLGYSKSDYAKVVTYIESIKF